MMLYSKEGSHDGGHSHSRVVLSRTVQPSHKTLLSCSSASGGVSLTSLIPRPPHPAFRAASGKSWVWRPGNEAIFHSRIKLLPVFADLQCELL